MSKLINFFKHPESLIVKIGRKTTLVPNKLFLKSYFKLVHGRKLDLKNPLSYNEKLQWLKLYDHKEIYTSLVDKYEVKQIVGNIIGKKHIIPTIGLFNSFDEIDKNILPNQFVIKCTHDSGGVIICKDINTFDWAYARKKITKALKHNYYIDSREWPYKNVKPRIIIEKYMLDKNSSELIDYKIYTFNGKAKVLLIISGRQKKETKANYYDMDFKPLDFSWGYPQNEQKNIQKPKNFEQMKEFAEKLSFGTCELRIDFYEANGNVYFGEITFFDGGGLDKIEPIDWDYKLGSWVNLPISENE